MRVPSSVAFTTLLLAVSLVFLGMAIGFESGTRGVPVSLAALLCLFVALQLLRDVRAGRATTAATEVGALEKAALGWLLFLAGLLALVGMLAGPAVFVVLYLRRRGGDAWPVAVAGGAVALLLVWLVLTRVVAAPIPGGWAGSLLAAAVRGPG